MFFDPLYFLFLLPGIALGIWAQFRIKKTFSDASEIPASSGRSGAQTAGLLMEASGVHGVAVEPTHGFLSDHYDPSAKVLRLSPEVYEGRSLAALGVAAHEAGHALQDARGYAPLKLRNLMVPLASFGGGISWILILLGFVLSIASLLYIGIAAFSATVIFQLVNLPVEFDASSRARQHLLETGLVTPSEDREVGRVLRAAAWTYVAATLTSILTLLYFLFRAGLLSNSDD